MLLAGDSPHVWLHTFATMLQSLKENVIFCCYVMTFVASGHFESLPWIPTLAYVSTDLVGSPHPQPSPGYSCTLLPATMRSASIKYRYISYFVYRYLGLFLSDVGLPCPPHPTPTDHLIFIIHAYFVFNSWSRRCWATLVKSYKKKKEGTDDSRKDI